jgi:hypothetical protein
LIINYKSLNNLLMETQIGSIFVPRSSNLLLCSRHFWNCYNPLYYREQLCWRRPAAKYYSTLSFSDRGCNNSEHVGSCRAVSSEEATVTQLSQHRPRYVVCNFKFYLLNYCLIYNYQCYEWITLYNTEKNGSWDSLHPGEFGAQHLPEASLQIFLHINL